MAVNTKDAITLRDLEARGREYQVKGKENKKATEQDIAALESKIQRGSCSLAATAISRGDLAKQLVKGQTTLKSEGGVVNTGSAFSATVKNIMTVGDALDSDEGHRKN